MLLLRLTPPETTRSGPGAPACGYRRVLSSYTCASSVCALAHLQEHRR